MILPESSFDFILALPLNQKNDPVSFLRTKNCQAKFKIRIALVNQLWV